MAYATLSELKQYLGVSSASDDALLTRLLDAATAMIESRCHRRFEAMTATRQVRAEMLVGHVLLLPDDLRAVTTITSDTGDTLSASDVTHSVPARYLRIDDDAPSFDARHTISVSATWGYTATPPADVAQACIRTAAWMYRQKDAQTLDLSGMVGAGQMQVAARLPPDIVEMLMPYVVSEPMPI